MWIYSQRNGSLVHYGEVVGAGYSGSGAGKNNPDMQEVHDIGPCPRGSYVISEPFDSAMHGPLTFRLTPLPGTEMFDRADMMIHGDAIRHPGCASHGCLCLPHAVREQVANSTDRHLEVVE
jgi:hypothetical protein